MINSIRKNSLLSYPMALMAAVVAEAKKEGTEAFEKAAHRVADHYNELNHPSKQSDSEKMSQHELRAVLDYVDHIVGTVGTFEYSKAGSQTSMYKLACSKGMFSMVLRKNEDSKISILNFEAHKLAA